MAAVTFSFATFTAMFPEFAGLSSAQAEGYFNRSVLLCSNSESNPAFASGNLPSLLYLLTAHVAWLNAPRDAAGNPSSSGSAPPAMSGAITSASEGSVSVSFNPGDVNAGGPGQPWYMQSRYGAEYWAATAPYRTARPVLQPTLIPMGGVGFSRWR